MRNSESDLQARQRRTVVVVVATLLLVFAVAAGLVALSTWAGHRSEGSTPPSAVTPSAEDRVVAVQTAREVVESAGTFGVKAGAVDGTNIMTVRSLLANTPASAGTFYLSRTDARTAVDAQVSSSATGVAPLSEAQSWTDVRDIHSLETFTVSGDTYTTQHAGTTVQMSGKAREAVVVDVSFSSVRTVRSKTSDDASWDHTFAVSGRTVPVTVTMLVADTGTVWQVVGVTKVSDHASLALWSGADDGDDPSSPPLVRQSTMTARV